MRQAKPKKVFFLVFAIQVFFCFTASSQIKAPQITPLSPNAASLFKYSEFPVNMYTGIPSISIPIYEVKSGGLSVPVSLSYHAGGIRFEEQASWVGLGWTLRAGGAVNRNIKGVADEKLVGLFNQSGTFNQGVQPCDATLFENVLNKYTDVQPDEFSYSAPGKSGRFLYQQGATQPTTIPYDPVKINRTYSPGSLSKFEMIDESGTKFKFGTIESTYGGSGAYVEESQPMPSSWLLTEVESADLAKKITFNYVSGESVIQKHSRQYLISVIDDVGISNLGCTSPQPSVGSPAQSNQTYYTSTQYLSTILFENGKIEFIQSPTYRTDIYEKQRSLEYIKVYGLRGGIYTLIKTVKFFYSYFKKNYNGVPQDWKLKLDKIQVMGADGLNPEEYSFQYHTNLFSGDNYLVNDYNSQDFWGYYNGKSNSDLIPTQPITFNGSSTPYYIGGANRTVDPAYMKEGVLKQIKYPTGGFSEFDYETNQYDEAGQTKYAGGLRVTTIKSQTSATDAPILKTYKYGQANSGKGYKMFLNHIGYFMTATDYLTSTDCFYFNRVYSSLSSMQIDGNEGSPVVYPYVTEYVGSDATNIGRTEYVYDNGTPMTDGLHLSYNPNTNMIYRQSNHWRRGLLTSKTSYSAAGAKVSETINTYQQLNYFEQNVGLMVTKPVVLTNAAPGGCQTFRRPGQLVYIYAYAYYPVKTGVMKQLKTIEKIFDQTDQTKAVAVETNHTFDASYLQPVETEKIVKSATGGYEERVTNYIKFPFHYSFTGTPSGTDAWGIKNLQDKNINSAPVEQYSVRKVISGSNVDTKVTSAVFTTFKSTGPYQEKLWQLESATHLTTASFGTGSYLSGNALVKNAAYKERMIFDQYDSYGNILAYHKADDVASTYIWGYNNTYPVAEVIGVPYSSVISILNQNILQNPSSDQALRDELHKIRQNFPAALVTTFTYIPLVGISSKTDPRNETTFYVYDAVGRLTLIKDKNNNILKKLCYNYKGQSDACQLLSNTDQSATYYSQSCPSGYTPVGYYVSVPAGLFTSSTQEGANTMAQQYAQSQANQFGTCNEPCNASTNCTGNNRRCINGTCQYGSYTLLSQYYDGYYCVKSYGFTFSDGSTQYDHTEYHYGYCY